MPTVPVIWETFGIFFGKIQIISCCNWWPWMKPGYIAMTQRQNNNQWSGGIAAHPAPKIPSTIIHWNYSSLLVQMKYIFKEKHCGKITKKVLFLHDNARAHWALSTQKKLTYPGFQCLDHPHYSPDLGPSDYHLFHGLKKQLKVRQFSSDAELIAAAEMFGWTTFWNYDI